jgi:hypothetical protein
MAKGPIAVERKSAGIIGQEDTILTTRVGRGKEKGIGRKEKETKMTERVIDTDHDKPNTAMREASSTVHEDTGTMKVVETIAKERTEILHLTTSTTVDGMIAKTDGISLWTRSQVAANRMTTNIVGLREIVPVVIEIQIPHPCTMFMGIVCKTSAIVNHLVACITTRRRSCPRNSGITKCRVCVLFPIQGITLDFDTER